MLLIQEVTHCETSTEQVAIPDQALEFQQGVDAGGVERITSAPSLSSQSPRVFLVFFFFVFAPVKACVLQKLEVA